MHSTLSKGTGLTGRSPNPTLLGLARVGLGTVFLVRTTGLATFFDLAVTPRAAVLLGWPETADLHFGARFVLPAAVLAAAGLLRTVGAILFTLGLWPRLSGIAAALAAYLVASQDPIGFNMTMHLLFLGMFVLACTDAGSRLALRPTRCQSPRSSFGLVRIWLASIYVWAGIAKLQQDWWSGDALEVFVRNGVARGPIARWALATATERAFLAPLLAVGEIGLGVSLLVRRTRRWALIAAYAVHVAFEVTLAPDLFGWAMAFLLLAFVGDIGPWKDVFGARDRARPQGQILAQERPIDA